MSKDKTKIIKHTPPHRQRYLEPPVYTCSRHEHFCPIDPMDVVWNATVEGLELPELLVLASMSAAARGAHGWGPSRILLSVAVAMWLGHRHTKFRRRSERGYI